LLLIRVLSNPFSLIVFETMKYLFLAVPILALSISHSLFAQEAENPDVVDTATPEKIEEKNSRESLSAE